MNQNTQLTDAEVAAKVAQAASDARQEVLNALLLWVDSRIDDEVTHRPDQNVHKSTLAGTWDQVKRKLVAMGALYAPRFIDVHIEERMAVARDRALVDAILWIDTLSRSTRSTTSPTRARDECASGSCPATTPSSSRSSCPASGDNRPLPYNATSAPDRQPNTPLECIVATLNSQPTDTRYSILRLLVREYPSEFANITAPVVVTDHMVDVACRAYTKEHNVSLAMCNAMRDVLEAALQVAPRTPQVATPSPPDRQPVVFDGVEFIPAPSRREMVLSALTRYCEGATEEYVQARKWLEDMQIDIRKADLRQHVHFVSSASRDAVAWGQLRHSVVFGFVVHHGDKDDTTTDLLGGIGPDTQRVVSFYRWAKKDDQLLKALAQLVAEG